MTSPSDDRRPSTGHYLARTLLLLATAFLFGQPSATAQKKPVAGSAAMPLEYIGPTPVMTSHRHDGHLQPAVGVQNIQILRANRTDPPESDRSGNTYNHAPMLAYWNNRFYVQYLAHEWEEHGDPTETYLLSSSDGYQWSAPQLLFPKIEYNPGMFTIAHQRMGFYVAPNGKLLTLAFYGAPKKRHESPNAGVGIGRAVREIKADGSWGPIYFIRYNLHSGYNEANTAQWYPSYRQSPDREFVAACEALLNNKLMTQQWWEEDRSTDGFYALDDSGDPAFSPKALSFFHRKDGKVVGLWKAGYAALSDNEGKSWTQPVRIPSKPEETAKQWGQRTDDGRYAITYNPLGTDFRMPLAMITSDDGITFDKMTVIHGEAPPLRFAGKFKNIGAQYNRGIAEGNGNPPGNEMWVVYSVSKEDLWISRIPIPAKSSVTGQVNENFESMATASLPDGWNIYRPAWSTIQVESDQGNKFLRVRDEEPYDYAKVVKVFPKTQRVKVEFTLLDYTGHHLEVEVADARGNRAVHLTDFPWDYLLGNSGRAIEFLKRLTPGEDYRIGIDIDVKANRYTLSLNGEILLANVALYEKVESVERLEFRTGMYRMDNLYSTDLLAGRDAGLPGADEKHQRVADYKIDNVVIVTP